MDKIITIIIPTYNMERYLDKCLTSLIITDENLMKMTEILVIIDGSKDRSSEIAHNYAKRFPNTFRVIEKKNGNYGSCINRGLSEAKGKYVKILDADDYFDTQNWMAYLKEIQNVDADLILTNYDLITPQDYIINNKKFNCSPNKLIDSTTCVQELVEVEMHAITYRTQLLLDMKYTQTEGISYTDTEWVLIPMQNIKTVYYINLVIYKYLIGREGQTMDTNIYLRNRKHITIIISKLIHEIYNKNLLLSPMSYFYKSRILGLYSRHYTTSLIENKFPSYELIELDEELKRLCKDIYDSLAQVCFSKIEYIKLWRNNNFRLPYATKIFIKIIKLKRKYLSNVKLGREK